jgi:hypothetical protein
LTLAKLAVFHRDSLNLKLINSNYELSYFWGSLQKGEAYKLTVVVSDVVVESMTVTIKFDNQTTASIEAALQLPVNNDSASLNFNFERIRDGEYVIEVTEPVIIMRLLKKQPNGGTLGGSSGFDDWLIVKENYKLDKTNLMN